MRDEEEETIEKNPIRKERIYENMNVKIKKERVNERKNKKVRLEKNK